MDAVETREPAFLQALRNLAASDAEAVADFFRTQGLLRHRSSPVQALLLPSETLLGIGLALRLASWELNGINLHVAAGLPSACEFKAFICRYISGPELQVAVSALSHCIWAIFHDEFAWQAMTDMQADVQLVIKDDEEFLNAMADFLWENRNALVQRGIG